MTYIEDRLRQIPDVPPDNFLSKVKMWPFVNIAYLCNIMCMYFSAYNM